MFADSINYLVIHYAESYFSTCRQQCRGNSDQVAPRLDLSLPASYSTECAWEWGASITSWILPSFLHAA